MNNCVICATLFNQSETRYTTDGNQIAEAIIQIPGFKETDTPQFLKIVAFGKMAETLTRNYGIGSVVVVEGRLGMNTIDRPEGFKEKTAELFLQKIYGLELLSNSNPSDPDDIDEYPY